MMMISMYTTATSYYTYLSTLNDLTNTRTSSHTEIASHFTSSGNDIDHFGSNSKYSDFPMTLQSGTA